MKIWIDLANAPHVSLFVPLIAELRRRAIVTVLTARDFAETLDLLMLHGLTATVSVRQGGATTAGKARAIALRALAQRKVGGRERPELAVSHNSYAHCLAAKSLGIRYVTMMDYEHTPSNHLSFRLADRVLLPSAVPFDAVRKYGLRQSKLVHYDGFKEQDGYHPSGTPPQGLPADMRDRNVVALARPLAEIASVGELTPAPSQKSLRLSGYSDTLLGTISPGSIGEDVNTCTDVVANIALSPGSQGL